MVSEGQPAPHFMLFDQDGQQVSLASLRGSKLILYFYPKDDTPGCTKEACSFRDAKQQFEETGARIFGVSPDTVASHRKFADKYGLPFTLLADPEKQTCEAYGVWKEKNMYGKKSMGVERTTFLIDSDGVVRKIFPRVRVDGHIERVLKALESF